MISARTNQTASVTSEKERSPSPVPTVASTSCGSEQSLGESLDQDKLFKGRPGAVLDAKASTGIPADYALDPPPLRANAWADPDATDFNIRSTSYLADKKKIPSLPSVFKLLTADLVKVDKPIYSGLCSHPAERIQTALRKEKETGVRELPEYIYAVNLVIPGKSTYHFVAYFGIDDISVLRDKSTPLGRVAEPFFFGDSDEFRNQTFKLIPRVQGNYMVRKAVGNKPSILGSKLKHYYTRTDRFFEMVVDIGSNKMAQKIVRMAQGCAKSLEVDMMFVLEGVDGKTLPERIMGGVQVRHLDFKHKDGQRLCGQP